MNSSIEVSEAIKLAEKLIQRTGEGRLVWEAIDVEEGSAWTPTQFKTTLEGNLRATISSSDRGELKFSLIEFDASFTSELSSLLSGSVYKPDKEILNVSVEKDPDYGYDTQNEKQLASLLVDLHGLARRSALRVAGGVEKALSYLDRIAS